MNDTPRTDANDLGWQFNEQYGDFDPLSDNPMPWLDFAKMLERELAAVTEQRDRLAEALQRVRDGYGGQLASPNCCEDCDFLIPIDAALQSLTPKSQ
jgi:hypothetical protein